MPESTTATVGVVSPVAIDGQAVETCAASGQIWGFEYDVRAD